MNALAPEDPTSGRFYCLKCGRRHNRSGTIGSFHHRALDTEREGVLPEHAAVGIAFVRATEDRRRPEATVDEVEAEFEAAGFREQFPHHSVGGTLRSWKDSGLISDARHSGKHWFLFLANRRTPSDADRSPQAHHRLLKQLADQFEQARVR